jgi:uncharacterized membrane protein YcaP (DUF421 family)
MIEDIGIIALRSVVVYVFIVIAIRIFGKRELSQISVIDLVFILLISNSVQNAMVGPDSSLQGGLIAATALFIANFVLKYFSYKFRKVNKIFSEEPVTLISNGMILEKNLDSQKITLNELKSAIREHGMEDIDEVKLAVIEPDGNISIISNNKTYHQSKRKKAHKVISKVE